MAGKIRIDGVTVEPNETYSGKQLIHLCQVSFENGMRAGKQTQAADIQQAVQRAHDRGYYEGKQARSDEVTGVLEALRVLKKYLQDTAD